MAIYPRQPIFFVNLKSNTMKKHVAKLRTFPKLPKFGKGNALNITWFQ